MSAPAGEREVPALEYALTIMENRRAEVRDAEAALRDAQAAVRAAEAGAGRAVRNLRVALNVAAAEVARSSLGYWNPNSSLAEYIEIEDGVTVDASKVQKIAAWLITHSGLRSKVVASTGDRHA